MGFYTDIKNNVAIPLIEKFGMPIILSRVETPENNPAFDPVEGEYVGNPTPTEYTGSGIISDFKVDGENSGFSSTAGVNIQEGDKLLKCVSIPAPVSTDRIIIEDVEYKIMGIGAISPAGEDILYNLQLRSWEKGS